MSSKGFISPILKIRQEKIKLVKENMCLTLNKNKSKNLIQFNEENYIIFNKVKEEILGNALRPHNFYWKQNLVLENEDLQLKKYYQIIKEKDEKNIKQEEKIMTILKNKNI